MNNQYDNRMMHSPMGREGDPFTDIGPALPARTSVYTKARKAREELQMAMDLAMDGPRCDVGRALNHMDRARAILGDE